MAGVELLDALTTTRAIRRYRDEPIPEGDLATILFAATRAPSGSNRQPFRFLVLRDGPRAREARTVLGESFRANWAAKRAADGYDDPATGDRASARARMAASMQHFVDHVDRAPVIVLACVQRSRRPALMEGASVFPACQNLLLAARELGYGGVMTMWHAEVEDRLAAILELPATFTIAATIPLGRPEGRHGPVRRLPLPELVFEDAWGASAPWAVDPPGTRFTGRGVRTPSAPDPA
jgi:nitroreductase